MGELRVKDFSLKNTLECGQVFRFDEIRGWHYLVAGDNVLKLRQSGNRLLYNSSRKLPKSYILNLFRLNDQYPLILKEISKDSSMRKAISSSPGIRIMKQDPWECTISYICSAHTSVKGVKKRVNNLAEKFGDRIEFDGMDFYSFPKSLGTVEQLRECGLGFRAKNLFRTLQIINSKKLDGLKGRSYSSAKSELVKLHGVGDKIADCIMLYSLGFLQAFPVDRWIKRAVQEAYFESRNVPNSVIAGFGQAYFGKYAGYAQQFLYNYRRNI